MDIDSVAFQMDSFTPPPVFGAIKRSLADNLQFSGGLMRYHSAPSSVLAGYLDDDFFPRESGSFTQAEESEFSRFLSDELCMANSLSNSKPSLPTEESRGCSMANEARTQQHIGQKRMAAQQSSYMGTGCNRSKPDVSRGLLSAIFEHSTDDSSNNFCTPATGTLQNAHVVVGNQNKSDNCSSKPLMPPISNFGQLPHTKSNLIRHSSSPADFLSRLVMEECSERPIPHFTGLYTQATVEGMPKDNTKGKHFPLATTGRRETIPPLPANGSSFNGVSNFGKAKDELKVLETGSLESPLGVNKSGLLRQSSSPAGLLSQLSLDAMSSVCEKVSLCSSPGNSSEEDKRERASLFSNQAVGFWDEVGSGTAAFGQRKRGRETEGQMLQGTPMSESLQRYVGEQEASHLNHFSIHTSTSPGSLASMEASLAHSVLCRARAKRGCATHPRSIAERVRRTKISERMRKLQELVPNMEKQTNTAAMLDEAVEYVKFLQRQVQELSENRPKCNGMCHLKGNAVAEE